MQALGHPEARPAIPREDPDGIEIVAPAAVASVDTGEARTGVEAVVALAGIAAVEHKIGCVFSLPGFTDEAVAWSDRIGIALFAFDRSGHTQPVGKVSSDAVARSVTVNPRFGTGSRADPPQVASILTEGLISGEVGEVSLWFGGLGQLLAFRLHPGDTETPAAIDVTLFPPPAPQPVTLDEGWEHADRRLPGGGHEHQWTRRCVHANHPPTVVAGDAVMRAEEALEACGAEMPHGRIELRRAPERDAAVPEMGATGSSIFGPLTRDEPLEAPRGETATPARIVGVLLHRTGQAGDTAATNGAAQAEAEGLDADGDVAWQLVARRAGGWFRGPGAWEVEARMRGELLQPNRPNQWFRPPCVEVGPTTWQLVRGWWRTVTTGDDLEVVAHEAVADLSAAYGVAGSSLERTGLRRQP